MTPREQSVVLVLFLLIGPVPVWGGIADSYPGDAGIENDPNVVFTEKFDESTLANMLSRWTDHVQNPGMAFDTDAPAGSPVGRSLTIPWQGGGVNKGGQLYKRINPGVNDTLYVRYYIKHPANGHPHHSGIWMGGYNPPSDWPDPQAGSRPVGNDRFIAAAEEVSSTRQFDHYNYWMDMRPDGNGSYWGNYLLNSPTVQSRPGQWMCVEQMVKLNNPTTAFNGEQTIWLDGVKVSHLGLGFPNGTWSGGIFTQTTSGSPFEGFRWRSDPALNLNWIWLQNYAPDDPPGFSSTLKFAHVVVAKSYIGCLAASVPSTPCDLNQSGGPVDVVDVQQCVNRALGVVPCVPPAGDINQDSSCNVIDVQRVVNAALGGACVSP